MQGIEDSSIRRDIAAVDTRLVRIDLGKQRCGTDQLEISRSTSSGQRQPVAGVIVLVIQASGRLCSLSRERGKEKRGVRRLLAII